MTGKERLEELKDYRKLPNNLANPDLFPPDIRQPIEIMRKDDVDWLIQQTEKAQELEAEVIRLRKALVYNTETFDHACDEYDGEIAVLEGEIQRYKEALENIRNKAKEDFFKTDVYILADEALKGDTK